jgi:hypothetical protein
MTEGKKIVDHLNVFNTLICQLSSMEVKYEDEDNDSYTTMFMLPKSWDHWSHLCGLAQQMPLIMTLLWELYC